MSATTARRRLALSRPLRRAWQFAILAAVIALTPIGRAQPDEAERPAPTAGAPTPAAIAALERRAQSERRDPDERAMRTPPPPGVDAASFPAPADAARAAMPLDAALRELAPASMPSAPAAPADDRPATDDLIAARDARQTEGLRRYAQGRLRMLEGDAVLAESEFLAATRADPSAPEPWRALGEAREASGDTRAAVAAFREALARDPGDIVSRIKAGRAAVLSREFEFGARTLAPAWGDASAAHDPAAPFLVAHDLATALSELGSLAAAAESLRFAASVPEPLPQRTAYWNDLTQLYRDRGRALRLAGDIDVALGRYDAAIIAYAEAALHPSIENAASLAPRRVYAAMRAGAPAAAALALLEELRSPTPSPDARAPLFAHIAANSALGASLLRALDAAIESRPPGSPPLRPAVVARARAACMSAKDAVRALRARLSEAPADADALADLFRRLPDPADALEEAERLTAASPWRAPDVARALLLHVAAAPTLLAAWDDAPRDIRQSPAGLLLRAALISAIDPAGAEAPLSELSAPTGPEQTRAPAAATLADALLLLGRFDDARAVASALPADPDDAILAKARLLHTLGADADAAQTISLALNADNPSTDARLLGAAIRERAGDVAGAETLLRTAIEDDPDREDAHKALLSLLLTGPAPAERAIGDAVRALRAVSPAGPTITLLVARERLSEGRPDRAEAGLLSLLAERPDDEDALRLLTTARLARSGAADAAAWLASRRDRYAHLPVYTTELARALAADDKAAEAVDLLGAWVAARPGDFEASRTLESILRGPANEPARADALALRRLANAPHTPEAALELAEVHATQRRWSEAGEAIRRLAPGARLPANLEVRAARLADVAAEQSEAGRAPNGAPNAPGQGPLPLLNALAERLTALSARAHLARLTLMAWDAAPINALHDALRLAAAQQPSLAERAPLTTLESLRAAGRTSDGLALVRQIAAQPREATPALLASWIVLAALAGDADAASAAVTTSVDLRRAPETLEAFMSIRGGEPDEEPSPAALAYAAGDFFAAQDHEAGAETLWRLALKYDPRHPMANNNIGYRMVEDGERLVEAHAMIAVAHADAPEEASITDSLGWARYRLGILRDRLDANGAVVMEGAVTILRRASAMPIGGSGEPEIRDHLGDALWAIGERDEAMRQWTRSAQIVSEYVNALRARAERDPRLKSALDRLRQLGDSARAKADAANAGAEPAVAPVIGGGDAIPNDPAAVAPPGAGPPPT